MASRLAWLTLSLSFVLILGLQNRNASAQGEAKKEAAPAKADAAPPQPDTSKKTDAKSDSAAKAEPAKTEAPKAEPAEAPLRPIPPEVEAKLQADPSIDGILTLGGDMAGQAVKAVAATGTKVQVGTFDVNADVVTNISSGKLAFAVDQQPYVQGYLGVTGVYLNALNGNDIGGGQPVYSGPAIITKDNAADVLKYAQNGTR